MKSNKKGFANIILVVIIVLLVGAVSYFSWRKDHYQGEPLVSPTSNTSDWKTYTNTKYNYEIKYPSTWALSLNDSGFVLVMADCSECDPPSLSLQSLEQYKNLKLEDVEKKYDGDPSINQSCTTISFLNELAYKCFTPADAMFSPRPNIFFIKNGVPFVIHNEIYTDIAEQVISSLKFTSPTVVTNKTGTLSGKVSIGPNCPVESLDKPCPPSPEAYASREFLVLSNDKTKTIKSFYADAHGDFSVVLPEGQYVVVTAKSGVGYTSRNLPSNVIIRAGQTTTLSIDIDTGIR